MEVEDAVFMSQFLPRSLNQIKDYDIKKILEGDVEETYALAVSALIGDEQHKPISTNEISSANIHHSQNSYDNEDDESMSEDESEASEKYLNKTKTLNKQERKAFLKENKKLVKEAKREKRLTKMKKKDKKQAIKKAKCKK